MKCLMTEIDATDCSLFDKPTVQQMVPLPILGVAHDRYMVALGAHGIRKFRYMGREKYTEVIREMCLQRDEISIRGHPETRHTINIFGTSGYGKSHIITACVVSMLKAVIPVVFIGHTRDLGAHPLRYLKAALAVAFGRDETMLRDILQRDSVDDLLAYVKDAQVQFALVIDQANSLDSTSMPAQEKEYARVIIAKLIDAKPWPIVKGWSSNNKTTGRKHGSVRVIQLFGGLSEQASRYQFIIGVLIMGLVCSCLYL